MGVNQIELKGQETYSKYAYHDWNIYAYEKHNKCPECKKPLKLTGRIRYKQWYQCSECKTKFFLEWDEDKIEGWDQRLNKMEESKSNVVPMGFSLPKYNLMQM